MLAWISGQRKRGVRKAGESLYAAVMMQARLPVFYRDLGVPDTVDGRFDLLALHGSLLLARLEAAGDRRGKIVAQAFFDALFRAADRGLRQAGVGDLSVPAHVKRMMKAFKGRYAAYIPALGDSQALAQALRRNLFGTVQEPDMRHLASLAGYAGKTYEFLLNQDIEAIYSGSVLFIEPGRERNAGDGSGMAA